MAAFRRFLGRTHHEAVSYQRRCTDHPPTRERLRQAYERPCSFTNLLPWLEYDPSSQCFLLDDGVSVGALFKIMTVSSEARTEDFLSELRDKLHSTLISLPEEVDHPWIVQWYVQDEPNLSYLSEEIRRYAQPRARGSVLSEAYFTVLSRHLAAISRSGGLFEDKLVTGGPWRGQTRTVRATLYRRRPFSQLAYDYDHPSPEAELNEVAGKFTTALATAGIPAIRCGGQALYDWLFRWFNPKPPAGTTETLLSQAPYPGDQDMPFGHDFSESLMLGMPHSDAQRGLWWFDGLPHQVISVQALRKMPPIGLFGAERQVGEHRFALFDRLPEHTVLAMTITIKAQDAVRRHLAQVQRGAVGDYPEAQLAARDAGQAQMEIAKNNKLYPVQLAFYVRGDDEPSLHRRSNQVSSLLLANGLHPIRAQDDLLALDSYLRNLPMAYSAEHDQREARRSRLLFSQQAANLAPVYGRATGTGHPGIVFFNRGAEPLLFDPLHRDDRKKNGHALIIGPTGAGKSATLVYLLLHMMALYRPRVFIIEVGNSFGLLGQYLHAHGVSLNQVTLAPHADVSLPPFSDALKLLDDPLRKGEGFRFQDETDLLDDWTVGDETHPASDSTDTEDERDNADENRDLLGEMEIAARIMITGGDKREDDRMTRADRLMIRNALLLAAQTVFEAGGDQVLTEDVAQALRRLPGLSERRQERAVEMADGMSLFCNGLAGHFFNRPGSRWPAVDVTIVDMGILAREGYEDQLTVAYIGLMNHIHDRVERQQNDARPTLVITDEGHIITTNPLLSPYVIKIVKMWRKLGAWFWIATQNLEDFPNASKRMLNMLEWWLCLVMPKEEVEQIARFKELSAEQKALLLATRKSPRQYTEGVVLTDEQALLFRNVPPPLALALAMTEKDEKARRHQIMQERGCSELEAVSVMAEELSRKREEGLGP